ncbi:hypothetical protein L208DRAFT_1422999 [Tricholoma matsutake]|nr:hypothetical protein L208DRAFT_1422999 [Tricholoma matsutake 945]
MACTASDKAKKPQIPEINWSANNSPAVWALQTEIKKIENYCVLYGKKVVAENTSSETKVTVYARIANTVLLELFALKPNTVHDHVKSKLEILKNEIEEEFPFFPTLHHIWASHPNVTPIIITTVLSLQGLKTVLYQPPNNNSNAEDNIATVAPPTPHCINLELHKQIIDEVKISLWTIEQAQESIKAIENNGSPRPAKHQKKVVQEFSPDWEEISSGSEDF